MGSLNSVQGSLAYRIFPMHWLDEAAGLALSFKLTPFWVFPEGWGARLPELKKNFTVGPIPKIPPIHIQWQKEQHPHGDYYREGSFWVPESQHLPESIREAHFRFIHPPRGSKKICLMLAGWGDHGYNLRMRLVHALRDLGVGALLLENPFHGRRILPGRVGAPVSNVLELAHLARAAVSEGRALIHHFKNQGYQVGLSGFSMGGNFAGIIAAILPYYVPTTLLAAPHSAEIPFFKGVFQKGIHWKSFSKVKNPKKTLRDLFQRVSLLKIKPHAWAHRAILLGGKADRFVTPHSVMQLHHHWKGSELRWRPGGHVSLWLLEIPAMVQAIADSFEK
jgi:alpha/beta hydrolase family protein